MSKHLVTVARKNCLFRKNSSDGCLAVLLQQTQQLPMGICEMREPKDTGEDLGLPCCTNDGT